MATPRSDPKGEERSAQGGADGAPSKGEGVQGAALKKFDPRTFQKTAK